MNEIVETLENIERQLHGAAEDAMIGGDYWEVVKVLNKIIEKLDELVVKANA